MTETGRGLADLEPFERVTTADETDGEFVRLELTVHPSPDAARADVDLPHARWAADGVDEHVNPAVEERFGVLTGEYEVVIAEEEHRLGEGDGITVPGDVPHRHRNPSDRPSRIRYEARPARGMGDVLESMFVLAQAGRTNRRGLPNPLQFAVIQNAHPGLFYSTDLPIGVQKLLFTILAPLGRLAGYEPSYSRDRIDELR